MGGKMNSTCRELKGLWPVGQWPKANTTIALLIFSLHTLVFVASMVYMYRRRNHQPYKSRNVVLVAISACGLQISAFNLELREYLGRDQWPCDLTLWLSYLTLALWLGPFAVQLGQLRNRLDWQEKLSGMPVHTPKDMSVSEYVASKYKAGNKRAYLSFAFFVSVVVGMTVVYSSIQPWFYIGCYGCSLDGLDFVLYTCVALFCIAFIFVAMVKVPRPAKGQPKHPLVQQMRVHYSYYLPCYVVYVVLSLLDPGALQVTGVFNWNHIASTLTGMLLFYTTAYPGIRLQWKQGSTDDIRLIDVLQDPEMLEMFEAHLKSEFSLESLRFYMESTALKSQYPTDSSSPEAMDTWRKNAFDIYKTFVARDALLMVNISDLVCKRIEQRMGVAPTVDSTAVKSSPTKFLKGSAENLISTAAATSIHLSRASSGFNADIFEEATRAIFTLMEHDTFVRFCTKNKGKFHAEHITSNLGSRAESQAKSSSGLVSMETPKGKRSRTMFPEVILSDDDSESDGKSIDDGESNV